MKKHWHKFLCMIGIHEIVEQQTNPHSLSVWTQRYTYTCLRCGKQKKDVPLV